ALSRDLGLRHRELLVLVLPAGVQLLQLARSVPVRGHQRRAARRIREQRRVGELRLRGPLLLLELRDPLLQVGDGALDGPEYLVPLLALERPLPARLRALSSRRCSGLGRGTGPRRLRRPPAGPVVQIPGLGIDLPV